MTVRTVDISWLIGSDVALETENGDGWHMSPICVRYVTFPENARHLHNLDARGLHPGVRITWGEEDLSVKDVSDPNDPEGVFKTLNWFVRDSIAASLGYQLPDSDSLAELISSAVTEIPVPTFGSPPAQWRSLRSIAAGGTGAAAVINGFGSHPSLLYTSSTAGLSLILMILIPAAQGVGDALERGLKARIDRFFDTPAESEEDVGG
ncbi:hypothetical protein ACWC0C_43660 [Streptomyces sp. NPDC001709]